MSDQAQVIAKLDEIARLLRELVNRDQARLRSETTAARRILELAETRDGGEPREHVPLPPRRTGEE